jgi:GNAT superfamily N-acetyltransferase
MEVEIASLSASELAGYAAVPIRFVVTERVAFDPHGARLPRELTVVPVRVPFEKDYDALPGMLPLNWRSRYRLDDWGILVARRAGVIVGGAAVAPAEEVGMDDEEGANTAVLWDLRVEPDSRGHRIGTALFRAAERWAVRGDYSVLLAETQDVNVPACRFYQAMGCTLSSYEPNAYPDIPEESRLTWRRELSSAK